MGGARNVPNGPQPGLPEASDTINGDGVVSTFPIQDEPFFLTRNCRNTRFIHEAAYHYYRGENTDASTIEGEPVQILAASGRASQARRLHAQLVDLISEEGVGAESIAVLVPSRGHRDFYGLLKNRPLPRPARWAFEEYDVEKGVRVDTVRRFKGLEASIVFFWGADEFDPEDDCEALYVTLSRAKSRLFLVGDAKRCEHLL